MRSTMFDFIRFLKQEKNVSEHTVRSYLADLEQLFDFLGDRPLAHVDHQVLRSFIGHLLAHKWQGDIRASGAVPQPPGTGDCFSRRIAGSCAGGQS